MNLSKKILIIGVSASGKSTLARKLATKTNLPTFFMDQIMWNPGWKYIGDENTIKEIDKISSGSQWVIEGWIPKEAIEFMFDRADTIIYLDYHKALAPIRYIKRYLKHRKNPRPELPGSPDKFSVKFIKRILLKKEAYYINKKLEQKKYFDKTIFIKSPKQLEKLLHL
jgi:adenylate kinase family enzyme